MTTKVCDLIDQYLIVLEKSDTGFSAYSPDVAGCIATGETLEETTKLMRSAVILHLTDVDELPKPRGIDAYVDALQDSEGEEFYLTHISVASLQVVSRDQSRN